MFLDIGHPMLRFGLCSDIDKRKCLTSVTDIWWILEIIKQNMFYEMFAKCFMYTSDVVNHNMP